MRDGRCSFVRRSGSGGAESVQEKAGGSIQPLESSRDYASGLRALLCGLSLSLSLSLFMHVHANPMPTHTHAHARTYACIRTRAHTLPQGYAYACKDTRGLITIPACTRSRTRKESKGEAETRNRKRNGMLRNSCTSDGVGFHRIQSGPI